jgi:hypothetical protein
VTLDLVWSAIILAEGGASVPIPFFTRRQRITIQHIVEPNAVPKGKEARVPHFTEDSLRRIIINPFYAITVASQLTEEHEPAMDEAEWVRTNATLIGEIGAASWLLDVLNGDIVTAEEVESSPPSIHFGYGGPPRAHPQRRGKKKQKKRRHQ